jgi:DNA-binding NarL/FixJ family response regulator
MKQMIQRQLAFDNLTTLRFRFMKPRILIVDDHEIVREGVRALIKRARPDWEIIGEATNGNQALTAVDSSKPDVVILDITMPGLSGLEAAQQLIKSRTNSKILMFTMHDSPRLAEDVREVGAQGLVLKSQASRDLIAAIEILMSGGTFFPTASAPQPPPQGSKFNPGTLLLRVLLPASAF